jgi:hypothetical protein
VIEFYNNIPKIDYSKVLINTLINPFRDFELKSEEYEKYDKEGEHENIKVIRL